MISSIGSSNSQIDIASLLKSGDSTQRAQGNRPKPPDPTEMFKKMDTDSDGQVTETEFTSAMEKMKENQRGQPPPPPPGGDQGSETPEELFAKIDSDSDGKVTLDELQADFESRAPGKGSSDGGARPDLTELFGKLDSDSDGQIGETEFKKLFEAMEQLREQGQSATYGNAATSSNGSLTSLLGYA